MSNKDKQNSPTWADVQISSEMPLDAIIGFLNVLNSRLAAIEDVVEIDDPKNPGNKITLTNYYIQLNKEAIDKMEKQNTKKQN